MTGKELAELACAMNLLKEYQAIGPIDYLRELARAEKEGRLVVLSFCAGAPLYEATGKEVREYEVEQFSIGVEDLLIHALDKGIWYRGGRIFGQEQIGKTVFLTLEEAEAALKKREIRIMSDREVFGLALKAWGPDAQTVMVFEEMSELQKELCKHARGKENVEQIAEEIADVQIMLEQMITLYNCEDAVKKYRRNKIERLKIRLGIKEAGNESDT